MMGKAVQQRCGHLRVAEYPGPLAEAEVGGDDDAGALVEFGEPVAEQSAAGRAERQVAEFVEDDEVEAQQAFGQLPGFVQCLFLFERVDQIDGSKEPDLLAMMLDRLHA